jgi:hypothetical protein
VEPAEEAHQHGPIAAELVERNGGLPIHGREADAWGPVAGLERSRRIRGHAPSLFEKRQDDERVGLDAGALADLLSLPHVLLCPSLVPLIEKQAAEPIVAGEE